MPSEERNRFEAKSAEHSAFRARAAHRAGIRGFVGESRALCRAPAAQPSACTLSNIGSSTATWLQCVRSRWSDLGPRVAPLKDVSILEFHLSVVAQLELQLSMPRLLSAYPKKAILHILLGWGATQNQRPSHLLDLHMMV
mmetsp:Transcript_1788/g.4522  ORF Transcript_1788/g.4522 Transcript_1788/m.4522 type:complete len:140 (+) Transcript_1788:891-1310(+)